jgi:hypothetical protein
LRFPDETLASAITAPGMPELGDNELDDTKMEMDDEAMSGGGLDVPGKKDQPFSRSPELKVSHKLAERKRRKEMKDMFDEVRELLPAERGSKSSKWEILAKGMSISLPPHVSCTRLIW